MFQAARIACALGAQIMLSETLGDLCFRACGREQVEELTSLDLKPAGGTPLIFRGFARRTPLALDISAATTVIAVTPKRPTTTQPRPRRVQIGAWQARLLTFRKYRVPTMSLPIEALEAELLRLPSVERARLLDRVVASLDADRARDDAWDQLAAARDAEIESGASAPVLGHDAVERIRSELL